MTTYETNEVYISKHIVWYSKVAESAEVMPV